jgi:hypothetical protein
VTQIAGAGHVLVADVHVVQITTVDKAGMTVGTAGLAGFGAVGVVSEDRRRGDDQSEKSEKR